MSHYTQEKGIPLTQGSYDTVIANAAKVGIDEAEARKILGGTPATMSGDKYDRLSAI